MPSSSLKFFLKIAPFGKGRARTYTDKFKVVHTITPVKTKVHARELAFLTKQCLNKMGFKGLLTGPVKAHYIFYIERPASVTKRIYPTVTPDLDNAEKQLNDVFNKLIWDDDTQVVKCFCDKRYAVSPADVGIAVYIKEIISREENEGKTCTRISKQSLAKAKKKGLIIDSSPAKPFL